MQSKDILFEPSLLAVEEKLSELKAAIVASDLDLTTAVQSLEAAYEKACERLYHGLSAWQKVWIARHPQRPRSTDYVNALLENPIELHGDRIHGDDPALLGGLAWFEGYPVVYLAQQKGRNTKENLQTNFGMMHPEGYRKARRLMRLAEKFRRPILSFVDTPAAHPGAKAELRGQATAIAENLYEMAQLTVPMVTMVIGEGGSGGALGVAMGNVVLMLEYAVYCVAPPEACSGILWKDSGEHAPEAAEGLKLTAKDLLDLEVIDEIIEEPIGGAHRNPTETFTRVRRTLRRYLAVLSQLGAEEVMEQRHRKFRNIGYFGVGTPPELATAG